MGLLGDLVGSLLTGDIGKYGESLTELELKWAKLFGKKGVTLRNIYIPKEDGETSEIDLVYITQKGVFVIESKNYSGWIFGDEYSQYWTQSLPNKQKNRFYNPIKQNRTHIKWLKKYLGEDIFCYSLIVFSNRCELKKVTTKSENLCVIKREDLSAEIVGLWKNLEDILNEEQIEQIRQKLSLLTNADEAVKQAHIDSINQRYKKTEQSQPTAQETPEQETVSQSETLVPETSEPASEDIIQQPICPRCGSPLVLRTAKKGANSRNQFYGCSAFPKCRYTSQIEANHSNAITTEEQ